MKLILMLGLFISSSAMASTDGYLLKMDLFMNGKNLSSPSMTVKAGEKGEVTQKTDSETTFIEVVANESKDKKKKGIEMKFSVGYLGKNGERTIAFKPEIRAQENEATEITVNTKEGEKMALSVVAQRKSL